MGLLVATLGTGTDCNQGEVPYGAGISLGYGGFIADARFTYRATYYNDLLRAAGSAESRPELVTASAEQIASVT